LDTFIVIMSGCYGCCGCIIVVAFVAIDDGWCRSLLPSSSLLTTLLAKSQRPQQQPIPFPIAVSPLSSLFYFFPRLKFS
jgi:hypothetical protein